MSRWEFGGSGVCHWLGIDPSILYLLSDIRDFLILGSRPIVPARVRDDLERSVFIFTVSGMEKGVGVFIGPSLALTALHNISRGDNVRELSARSRKLDEPVNLTIRTRHRNLDCLLLNTTGGHSYSKIWRGDPEILARGPRLLACDYHLGLASCMPRQFLPRRKVMGIKPADGIVLSEDKTRLLYLGQTHRGDSGAPLVTRGGEVVAIHLEGLNSLRGELALGHPDIPERVGRLELNVSDAVDSTASACIAVVASSIPIG